MAKQSPSIIAKRRLEEKHRAQRLSSAAKKDSAAPARDLRRSRGASFATRRKEGPKYWFARKSWGWGWTPASKEGYSIVALHIALIIFWADAFVRDDPENAWGVAKLMIAILIQTALLILIAYKKGEPLDSENAGRRK